MNRFAVILIIGFVLLTSAIAHAESTKAVKIDSGLITGTTSTSSVVAWPAFNEKTGERTMILGDKVEAVPGLDSERVAFFDRAYAELFK